MDNGNGVDIQKLFEEGTAIDDAIAEGVARAVWEHGRLGQKIAIEENGEVVVRHVTSEEMRRCEATLGIERPPYD